MPLPIYSGSGCVYPFRSPTHTHFSSVSGYLQHHVACPQARAAERSSLSGKKRAGGIHSTCPPRHCNRSFRHPFRVCIALGTTRMRAPAAWTALPRLRSASAPLGLWRDPTWSTLIKVRRLKHLRTTPAPDTTPAATLLARLFLSFTTAVTLVGHSCVQTCQVCPRLPPWHSCRCATAHRFRGLEYRSCSPIRPGQACADSAPSLLWLTGNGLMPLSSLSFSRSAF